MRYFKAEKLNIVTKRNTDPLSFLKSYNKLFLRNFQMFVSSLSQKSVFQQKDTLCFKFR